MTTLIQGFQSERIQHLIDWSVFVAGATSLALALLLTAGSLLIAEPTDAAAAAPTPMAQPQAI